MRSAIAAGLRRTYPLATFGAGAIEPRSIYDARLSDAEVDRRQRASDHESEDGTELEAHTGPR
jgi:hypothetical protein